jgi:perosamine synthetase
MEHPFIPVCEPLLDGNEEAYVAEVMKSGWISSAGPWLERFEREFAVYCGVRHAIAVCNGTTALQVAVHALELPVGSEIILPSFTILSCALAVVEAGCVPVFTDVEADTLNISAEHIARAITPRTRAIMLVHMYGHPVDMAPIRALADAHGLAIIEDAAEAHGGTYGDARCGSLGDLATFSFYANKLVTTGEGGMLTTNNDTLAERCRSLRNLSFMPGRRFVHERLGWNYRMTNVQAAIGVAQLETATAHLERRRAQALLYRECLQSIPGLTLPVERPGVLCTFWMHGFVLDSGRGVTASEVMRRLRERGIDSRPYFQSLHSQKPFESWLAAQPTKEFPVSDWASVYGLYLPSGLALTDDEIRYVCGVLAECLPEYRS